jgi:hypothetical protein
MAVDAEAMKEWGREHGWDIEEGKRVPSGLRQAYDARNNGHSDFPTDSDMETEEGYINPSTGQFEPGGEPLSETAPVIRPVPIGERLKAGAARVRKVAQPGKTRRRRSLKPRVPVDKVLSVAWTGLSRLVALAGPNMIPVSRVLVMQAPVVGMLLEDEVKGTIVDRVLQPLARVQTGSDLAFALVGPPLITAAIVQKHELYPVLRPALRYSLMTWIRVSGPKLEKWIEESREFEEKYGTQVDEMIDRIFAPEPTPEEDINA